MKSTIDKIRDDVEKKYAPRKVLSIERDPNDPNVINVQLEGLVETIECNFGFYFSEGL